MATAIAALQGKFGETEYWLTTMNVGELLRAVRLPKEIPGWEDLTLEERYQRDININRVRKHLAPYFADNSDRFSGSLILAVMNDDGMLFEPLSKFGARSGVPEIYKSASTNMGFLTLPGDEILIPLDGQHRVKAFKYAIDGADDNNRPLQGVKANTDLASDQVSVILVRFEPARARRIFSKINRYAKPTARSDDLITDDDDAVAVITRELLRAEDGVVHPRLVKIGANTLNKTAPEFTTLATFYDATTAIAEGSGIVGVGGIKSMNEEQRECVKEVVRPVWKTLLASIDLWAASIVDPSENGDGRRAQIREETLLGKPVGQISLVRAFLMMRDRCAGVPENELCARLSRINWDVDDSMWHGVLMNPNGRVMSGKNTVNHARNFIAHLGGANLTEDERVRLLDHIHGQEWKSKELPPPVG